MVPRGGVEPLPIQLKVHHFLNGDFPVYLPVYPALSSQSGGCASVPPYPSRVGVRHERIQHFPRQLIVGGVESSKYASRSPCLSFLNLRKLTIHPSVMRMEESNWRDGIPFVPATWLRS